MSELTQALIALAGLITSIVVAAVALLRARTKVAEADAAAREKVSDAEEGAAKARAKREEAQAALAEAQLAQQRASIPPGGGGYDLIAVFRQELAELKRELLARIETRVTAVENRVDRVDAAHDETRGDVSFLKGKLNGH